MKSLFNYDNHNKIMSFQSRKTVDRVKATVRGSQKRLYPPFWKKQQVFAVCKNFSHCQRVWVAKYHSCTKFGDMLPLLYSPLGLMP